jgi:hypothetical protein
MLDLFSLLFIGTSIPFRLEKVTTDGTRMLSNALLLVNRYSLYSWRDYEAMPKDEHS